VVEELAGLGLVLERVGRLTERPDVGAARKREVVDDGNKVRAVETSAT